MKKINSSITYSLRELIRDEHIQSIVSDLYRNRTSKGVSVFLPLANERFNKIASDPEHEGVDNLDELCFHLDDTLLLDEFIKLNILSVSKDCTDEDDDFTMCVRINDPEFIEHVYGWIKDKNLILNYGFFSLHTFTGEAYCLDNKYIFHTNKGLFRVFRAFLEEPTHILTYAKIYNTFQDSDRLTYRSEAIHQIIGEIKEKLYMKGSLSKLFIPSSDKYYLKSS